MSNPTPLDLWMGLVPSEGVVQGEIQLTILKGRNTGKSMMLEYLMREHGIVQPILNLEITDDDITSKFQER